jgi:hypothetical protein
VRVAFGGITPEEKNNGGNLLLMKLTIMMMKMMIIIYLDVHEHHMRNLDCKLI